MKYQMLDIEQPATIAPSRGDLLDTLPPRISVGTDEPWDLTLEEAVRLALANSQVMRDLGGQLVNGPAAARTVFDPAIRESDPRFGTEAALSAFDTQLTSNLFWTKNDRVLNQRFQTVGPFPLDQDLASYQAALAKRAATGTLFTARHNVDYDYNNLPTSALPSIWNTNVEAEFRHPLLQGGGIAFNEIAGPNATPGLFLSNGVLIARLNTDVALADFEAGVRNLISDVENAYWDLYFAYRDLDAKVQARNSTLEAWRIMKARYDQGLEGATAGREAQLCEQYYVFQAQVEESQVGVPGRGTLTGGGTGGGSFRGSGGVFAAERRLRFVLGLSPTDDRIMRPADEPSAARVVFDWQPTLTESLHRRVELRKQRWTVKRRELELLAARNFALPRLDAVGTYRWRGFGDDLLDPNRNGLPRFDNAYQNLTSGDFQEWQVGMQMQVPLGFRQGLAAVRNGELQLARERAVLRDMELQVSHDISHAIAELERAYTAVNTAHNRRLAAARYLEAAEVEFETEAAPSSELFLEAQRRSAEADSAYYRALIEYALAVKNVHFEKGSLLEYDGVHLSEGRWATQAYQDAWKRELERRRAAPINYGRTAAPIVSRGLTPQIMHEETRSSSEVMSEPVVTQGTSREPSDLLPGEEINESSSQLPQLESAESSVVP